MPCMLHLAAPCGAWLLPSLHALQQVPTAPPPGHLQSQIVKNVVQYGIYDSMQRLLFTCKVGGQLSLCSGHAARAALPRAYHGGWRHRASQPGLLRGLSRPASLHVPGVAWSSSLASDSPPHPSPPPMQNNTRVWYQVHTRTRVGRHGNILNVAYTAKRITA